MGSGIRSNVSKRERNCGENTGWNIGLVWGICEGRRNKGATFGGLRMCEGE